MGETQDVLTCNVFDVSVIMEGEKLPLYGIQYEELEQERKASCWIPSTAGKSFAIQYEKNEKNGENFTIKIFLDEYQAVYTLISQDTKRITDRCWVSDSEVRSFIFANLDMTDDDRYIENPPRQDIGMIRIELQPCITRETPIPYHCHKIIPNVDKVHERSKKGLSHRIDYGPIKKVPPRCNTTFNFQPFGTKVTMLFNYRSLEVLQANGIAPRMTSQSEQEEDIKPEIIDLESDDDEDVEAEEKELLTQLEAIRNKKRTKRNGEHPRKRVKTEPSHFLPGEVIDLTL